MSVWLDGPLAGPLVDGDLCELRFGDCGRCVEPAMVLAEELSGRQVLLCGWHADRHGLAMPMELVAELEGSRC